MGLGLVIQGLAFFALGGLSLFLVRTSEQHEVIGNLWAVSTPVTSAAGNSFKITDDAGLATTIHCRYGGPGLREGERVRVRYIAYNHHLLEFSAITGPYTGWHFEESRGEWGYLAWMLTGLGCAFLGNRLRAPPAAIGTDE